MQVIQAIFKDVSESSLKNNFYLKINKNEQTKEYHEKTNEIIKQLAKIIKNNNTKHTKIR